MKKKEKQIRILFHIHIELWSFKFIILNELEQFFTFGISINCFCHLICWMCFGTNTSEWNFFGNEICEHAHTHTIPVNIQLSFKYAAPPPIYFNLNVMWDRVFMKFYTYNGIYKKNQSEWILMDLEHCGFDMFVVVQHMKSNGSYGMLYSIYIKNI